MEAGEVAETIKSAYNRLGQLTEYTDASGASTSYSYEDGGDGRLVEEAEPHGSQSYAYDSTTGALREVDDSAAGVFSAAYDVEGNMVSEEYPAGLIACFSYSGSGEEVGVLYYKSHACGEGPVWFEDAAVPTAHGQWASQQSSLSGESYSYDQLGRLSEVQEEVPGEGCTTRIYGLDAESNRTSLTTRPPGVEGGCAAEGGSVESHSYDQANRLTDPGVAYGPFGEVAVLPGVDAGGVAVESAFYADGQLAEQSVGEQSVSYGLDPAGRVARIMNTGGTVSTLVNHYSGEGEAPAWSEEALSGAWSRNIEAFGGLAAIQREDSEVVLELEDLQGNIAATASVSEEASEPLSTERSTEYGVPAGKSSARYGWLGGDLLPREATGAVAMGARSYIPELGRFLQTDPISGGSANAYAYTYGNPVNEADPSGESELPSWLEEWAGQNGAEIAAASAAREQAEREEAERIAAEAAAAAMELQSPGEGGAAEMVPLGGYVGWECEYAAETHQPTPAGCRGGKAIAIAATVRNRKHKKRCCQLNTTTDSATAIAVPTQDVKNTNLGITVCIYRYLTFVLNQYFRKHVGDRVTGSFRSLGGERPSAVVRRVCWRIALMASLIVGALGVWLVITDVLVLGVIGIALAALAIIGLHQVWPSFTRQTVRAIMRFIIDLFTA